MEEGRGEPEASSGGSASTTVGQGLSIQERAPLSHGEQTRDGQEEKKPSQAAIQRGENMSFRVPCTTNLFLEVFRRAK